MVDTVLKGEIKMNKKLICYFSASGVTKNVALKMAQNMPADLFEIVPKERYTSNDLDWNDKTSRSTKEMNDINSRPEILNKVENIDNYDTILLGYPIWWYTCPRIINTFMEETDLSGKKVYIFVTSGGSAAEGSFNDLKKTYPNVNFIKAKRFNGYENAEDYLNFIEEK